MMDYRKTAKRIQLALCRRGRRIKINQMQYISKKTGCPATMYVVVETEVLENGKVKNKEICTSSNIVDVVSALARLLDGTVVGE